MWAGIVNGTLIGPFIFLAHMLGITYLQFLGNDLPLLLEDASLDVKRNNWFMNNGAPSHLKKYFLLQEFFKFFTLKLEFNLFY